MVEYLEMLDKEYKFYLKNQADLVKKYKGKYLVIKDEKVTGVFRTREEAYEKAISQHELGTFLIQECLENSKNVTQTFHSRVVF